MQTLILSLAPSKWMTAHHWEMTSPPTSVNDLNPAFCCRENSMLPTAEVSEGLKCNYSSTSSSVKLHLFLWEEVSITAVNCSRSWYFRVWPSDQLVVCSFRESRSGFYWHFHTKSKEATGSFCTDLSRFKLGPKIKIPSLEGRMWGVRNYEWLNHYIYSALWVMTVSVNKFY